MTEPTMRKWAHRPGDTYTVVSCQYVGNETDYQPWYTRQAGPFAQRETAWRHGLADLEHDDFNLAVVRDGRLVALLWNDQLVDDAPDVLADVNAQTMIGCEPASAEPGEEPGR